MLHMPMLSSWCRQSSPYITEEGPELEGAEKRCYAARSKQGEGNTEVLENLTAFEKYLMTSQEVMEIRGKTGRGVPVLIPQEVAKALSFIADEEVRKRVGIDPKNPYLFAKLGEGRCMVASCYESLRKACREASRSAPEKSTSTSSRKYMATFTQALDLNAHQLEWVTNHLGHSLDIHKLHYRNTSTEIERTQTAKLLLIQDHGLANKFANVPLQDIQLEDIITTPTQDDAASESCENERFLSLAAANEVDDELAPEKVLVMAEEFFHDEEEEERRTKKVPCTNRIKWTEEEEDEIKAVFAKFLRKKQKPDAKTVKKLMKESENNKGHIYKRSVSALKNKVYRMVKQH